jgi:parallel beta-helix repeat protein
MMRTRSAVLAVVLLAVSARVESQPCRISTVTGGSSTTSLQAGLPVGGSLSSTDVLDNTNFFEVSNVYGITARSVRAMVPSNLQENIQALFGGVFANPAGAVTITRIDITSNVDLFRSLSFGLVPFGGWSFINARNVRWTGSVGVAANSAQSFLAFIRVRNNAVPLASVTMTVVTSAGTFSSSPLPVTVRDVPGRRASNATAGFAIPAINYLAATGPNITFRVQASELGGGGAGPAIAAGTLLTISIPAGWSNVAVAASTPWALNSITQPSPTSPGQVLVRTTAAISNTVTAAAALTIQATVPVSSSPNLFPVTFSFNGVSGDGFPVISVNEAFVRIAAGGSDAVRVEFLSLPIGPGPVRQIDFRTDFNIVNGSGSDPVTVEVFNNLTSTWDLISTVVPGASNSTAARSFTTDFERYVDGTNRMRVRLRSPGASNRRLRIDLLQWSMMLGFTVNNSTGSDANPGHIARPFATIGRAATGLGASGAIYVDVGNSRSGSPYDHDVSITASGSAGCRTLVQGLADVAGQRPLIRGVVPSVDAGVLVGANFVDVAGFEIENTQVGLYADTGTSNVRFSSNVVRVPDFGYGLLLQTSSASAALNNSIEAASPNATFGIWDFTGSGNVIDGNRVRGFAGGAEAIVLSYAAAPVVQRNIVAGNYVGIHFSHCSGPVTLYNNTVDSNQFLAVYSEDTVGAVTSRNNVITNNGIGWGWDGLGSVSSNFDDVFANANDYNYHAPVTPGANSISASPNFIQTVNPSLPTYYRLGAGSPCIDAGTPVGLPFNGVRPDIGAVEN